MQTVFHSESEEMTLDRNYNDLMVYRHLRNPSEEKIKEIDEQILLLQNYRADRKTNSVKVLSLDNFLYNNQVEYANIRDLSFHFDTKCSFCRKTNPKFSCSDCLKVRYCSRKCLEKDFLDHEDFCNLFQHQNIRIVELIPMPFSPANTTIKIYARPLKFAWYENKEQFMVKLNHGDNSFGLREKDEGNNPDENKIVMIYDQYRNISGLCYDKQLIRFIRELGKLSGEKVYNKRTFLMASVLGKTKAGHIKIKIKTDIVYPDQDW